MWKIESVDKLYADKFGWGSNFRLRHIGLKFYCLTLFTYLDFLQITRTGLYLGIRKHEDANAISVFLEKKLAQNSVFQFRKIDTNGEEEQLNDRGGSITVEDFLRLRHASTGLWICVNQLAKTLNEIEIYSILVL